MIKILYVIGTLNIGGAERHLVEVVTHLDREIFEPSVCVLSDGGPLRADIENAGIPVFLVDFLGLKNKWSPVSLYVLLTRTIQLYRLIKRGKFDIVHGYLFWAYVSGALAGRAARVPLKIASRRSLGHFKAGKEHYLLLERVANKVTDLWVANSEAVKRDTVLREGIDPSQIVVIHNGIDARRYGIPVDIKAKKQELGIGENGPVIGMISNYIHYKGHLNLMAAFRQVASVFPDAVCLCVGEGPQRAVIEAEIKKSGLSGRVILSGTRRDIPELLSIMDVSVLASFEEGFSNTILESMAAGLPVVATAVGGNPEAVGDGVTGILVPPGDSRALAGAILRILGDPELASHMGREGKKRVEREFSIEKMIGEMETLYTKLAVAPGQGKTRRHVSEGRAR